MDGIWIWVKIVHPRGRFQKREHPLVFLRAAVVTCSFLLQSDRNLGQFLRNIMDFASYQDSRTIFRSFRTPQPTKLGKQSILCTTTCKSWIVHDKVQSTYGWVLDTITMYSEHPGRVKLVPYVAVPAAIKNETNHYDSLSFSLRWDNGRWLFVT